MRVRKWAARWVPPGAVAAVWVYEGLVAKVLGARPDERATVASVPVLGGAAGVVRSEQKTYVHGSRASGSCRGRLHFYRAGNTLAGRRRSAVADQHG